MSITFREGWALIHGLLLGSLFLLSFTGGLAGLWSYRPELLTAGGMSERVRRLRWGTAIMAAVAWITVVSGTFIVYPWYRAPVEDSPRTILKADPAISQWHTFGMELKEHIGWLAPILATAVVFIVFWYGTELARNRKLRSITIWLFVAAFAIAAVAGLFGALITKVAAVS